MQVERVEFAREGGFAGIPLRVEFETKSLPPEEAAPLQELVDSADVFNLPSVTAPAEQGADRFEYTLTLEGEGRRHTIRITDPAPQSLERLIEFLTKLARRARGKRPA